MKIALGTVQFGLPYGVANTQGQVSLPEAGHMLQLAADSGIDTLDTAIGYGDSESRLGQIGVQGFKVVTKLPALPGDCSNVKRWVEDQLAGSLARLGVDRVYGLLLHRPEQLYGPHAEMLYHALDDARAAGQVDKIGVSIYHPEILDTLTRQYRLDLVQAPFNLVDRRLEKSGWLQRLNDAGVEIHVRSAFLQGLLLMERRAIPAKFMPWAPLWDQWHHWLGCHGVSALQACLAFLATRPEIDRVVVGADSARQLGEIIQAANIAVSEALPEIGCEDDRLINPANWTAL